MSAAIEDWTAVTTPELLGAAALAIDVTKGHSFLSLRDELRRRGADIAARQANGQELPERLEDLEKRLILRAYYEADGVKTRVARLLGIKTSALYYKLDKYGIGTVEKRKR
jgi:DNA-binding NtrC family response regulator